MGNTVRHWPREKKKNFLDKTPEVQTIKIKIERCDYINLRGFCTAKETLGRKQLTEWEKLMLNYSSDKELLFKMCKKNKKLNNKTIWLRNG